MSSSFMWVQCTLGHWSWTKASTNDNLVLHWWIRFWDDIRIKSDGVEKSVTFRRWKPKSEGVLWSGCPTSLKEHL
ncbi:unnamed protein product [Rhodiola kirilowii]